jgi:hypothetical protein
LGRGEQLMLSDDDGPKDPVLEGAFGRAWNRAYKRAGDRACEGAFGSTSFSPPNLFISRIGLGGKIR